MRRKPPASADRLMMEARYAQQQGDVASAQRIYRKLLQNEPQHWEPYRQLARFAHAKGDVEQATKYLKKAIHNVPESEIGPLLELAIVQSGERDYIGAERTARLAVDRAKSSPVALSRLGGILIMAKRPDEAIAVLQDARELAKAKPGAIMIEINANMARALLDAGQYEAAVAACDEGLANGGVAVPQLLSVKANSLIRLQRLEAAEETLILALTHSPEDHGLWVNLGRVRGWLKKPQQAIEAFDRAIKLSPEDPEIVALRVNEARQIDAVGALATCDDYLAAKPFSSAIFALKAQVLRQTGRALEADRLIGLDRFIVARDLPTPAGFASHAAFAAALADDLRTRTFKPTRNHAPQLGLMTEELATVKSNIVRTILRDVEAVARDVCAELKASMVEHPWLAAMPARLRTSAWATFLNTQGYQMSHYHSGAWLNAVYYLRIPEDGMGDAFGEDGWIEFGQPMPHLQCNAEPPVRSVRPREGMVVFFPAYMFHLTKPFTSTGQRISLAFDFIAAEDTPTQLSWAASLKG